MFVRCALDTKILLKEIGARISAKRREKGVTQEQLAEIMDVSIQMISNLEGGKKAIRPENLLKLCSALDVSTDYILRGARAEYESFEFMKKYSRLTHAQQELLEKIVDSWQE